MLSLLNVYIKEKHKKSTFIQKKYLSLMILLITKKILTIACIGFTKFAILRGERTQQEVLREKKILCDIVAAISMPYST